MIDILLVTYNGEKYLQEQVESLLNQTYTNWRILIRDDGSTDSTISLIETLACEYPDKIIFIKDNLGNLGPAQSFSQLLEISDASYVAFCDQDDVWFENKLEIQMKEMKLKEKLYGQETPILIHSDLIVADHKMKEISASFWKYQNLNPTKMNKLNVLLVQNFVTGCTSLLNKKLVDISRPIHKNAIMHDWWVALMAISNGIIVNVNTPTVYYRQHEGNTIGANEWGIRYIYKLTWKKFPSIKNSLLATKIQAAALQEKACSNEKSASIVNSYVSLFDRSWLWRHVQVVKHKFNKYGFIRNIAFFLFV